MYKHNTDLHRQRNPANQKLFAVSFGILAILMATNSKAASPGESAPICTVESVNNPSGTVNTNDFGGKIIYLDFWASWCAPCRVSLPLLNELRNEFEERDFEVVGINLDENNADAANFLKHYPVDFPIGFDPDGVCPKAYGVQGMPSSYLIDGKGIIREVHLGFKRGNIAKIRKAVELLKRELESETDTQPYQSENSWQ